MSEESVLRHLLAKTQGRIDELRRRLEVQEGIRADLEEQITDIGGTVAPLVKPSPQPGANVARNGPPPVKKAKPSTPKGVNGADAEMTESWADRIAEIMRRNGGTMRFGQIVEELERQGETELGKHRLGSRVFGVLRRRVNRFEKLSRGEYRLKT